MNPGKDNSMEINSKPAVELPFPDGRVAGKISPGKVLDAHAEGPETWPQSLKTTLNILFQSNLPSILLWGPDHICFCNDPFKPFVNPDLGADKILGKRLASSFNGMPVSKKIVDALLAGKKSNETEEINVPVWTPDLKPSVPQIFHYSCVYNEEGAPGGVLVTGVPIHEIDQVKSETNLANQQVRDLIYQSSFAIIVLLGKQMTVEIVNEAFGELIGRPPAGLLGKNIFDIIPEAEEEFRPIIESVYKTGHPVVLDEKAYFVFKDNDRTYGYINVIIQPYRAREGQVVGVIVLCNDVTHHVLDKKKLMEAEWKARLAIESGNFGTYEIDLTSDALVLSERSYKIWGMEKTNTRADFVAAIHPDDLEIRAAAHLEAIRSGNLVYEARVIWKDKSVHWVKINGKVLFDHSGKPLTLLGVIRDITDERMFEQELSMQVKERTEELQALNEELVATNEELSESNDQLMRANKDLEQFAYVASHDLQEPLRKIQVFTNMVNQKFSDELGPNATTYFQKINSSANRMSSLIKDLLDYSRLIHNRSLFKETDLNVVVAQVINDFELLIDQKNVAIRVEPLPSIQAIPIQMNQLFYNLINNALKFSRKGVQPSICVSSRILPGEEVGKLSLKTNRPYIEVNISDNGIGFSQDYAEQIFVIFQRLNEKSRYGGYGIGLALCRRIVENHDGIILAKGIENEGAIFTFILPVTH